MLFGLVPLAIGILDDSENKNMQAERTKIQCEVGLNSITNLGRTFEHLALVLHYPPRELNFAKMEQVCILQKFDFAVWPKMCIKKN